MVLKFHNYTRVSFHGISLPTRSSCAINVAHMFATKNESKTSIVCNEMLYLKFILSIVMYVKMMYLQIQEQNYRKKKKQN